MRSCSRKSSWVLRKSSDTEVAMELCAEASEKVDDRDDPVDELIDGSYASSSS
jgi:hypothetical protein